MKSIVFVIILTMLTLSQSACTATEKSKTSSPTVCFVDHCFSVELAHTPEEMSRGLQFRESLEGESGMLFIFPNPGRHSFWMKDTLIPLDMIWLDESQRVVYIAREVQPCKHDPCETYAPPEDARYVLEINPGLASKDKIDIGSQATFINVNNS